MTTETAPRLGPPREMIMLSTVGFKTGDEFAIDGVYYCVVDVLDHNRLVAQQLLPH